MELLLLCSALMLTGVFAQVVPLRSGQLLEADANGDGALDFDEFLRSDARYMARVRNAFGDLDANKDNKISFEEIVKDEERRLENVLPHSKVHFGLYDLDNSGFLEEGEVATFIAEKRFRKSSRLGEIMAPFDKNGDRRFDAREFNEFLYFFPFDELDLLYGDYAQKAAASPLPRGK
ncbi:hypothetical protein QR680_005214 [Steinernema hermaphroditum]|uniref:EF-hand domain-containing protein n=1 Tax=Steinernema hermaphroditum TaxID=289476 RepID=A0AA39HR79_9BILA|nr:hypothetical protein QR680_005214 [Steinernema hermaphroditum]